MQQELLLLNACTTFSFPISCRLHLFIRKCRCYSQPSHRCVIITFSFLDTGQWGLKLRPSMMCVLDTWRNQDTLNNIATKFPLPTPPMDYIPQPSGSPFQGDLGQAFLPSLSNEFLSPASMWHYSHKSATSLCRTQGWPQPLDATKPASPRPCWFPLFLRATSVWSCRGVLLPEVVFVINKLLRCHLPSVRCCVFSKPIALGWEFLPHQRHEEEAVKTHILCVCVSWINNNLLGFPSCVNRLSIPATLNVNFLFLEPLFLEPATLEPLICCRLACWWRCLPRSCPLLEISRV